MIPRSTYPPVPPGFADRFVKDGWRGIERVYRASTPVLLKWIELSGGPELYARRRAAQRCGRKAEAAAVTVVRIEG